MSNNENMLKKVEELISEYYGPNYNNQTVDFINGVGQYYANNPENFMELFNNLVTTKIKQFKLWLLNTLIQVIKEKYQVLKVETKNNFRQYLINVFSLNFEQVFDELFVVKKYCELFNHFIFFDFPENNNTIFDDILTNIYKTGDINQKINKLFLLLEIFYTFNEEFILFRHTYNEIQITRSNTLKEYIRKNTIQNFLFILKEILQNEEHLPNDKKIIQKSIEIISQLIDWIPFEYFYEVLNIILGNLIKKYKYYESCCSVIYSIIKKGMDPKIKREIFDKIQINELLNNILKSDKKIDEQTLKKISEIINLIGLFIIENFDYTQELIKSNNNNGNNEIMESFNWSCNELRYYFYFFKEISFFYNQINYDECFALCDSLNAIVLYFKSNSIILNKNEIVLNAFKDIFPLIEKILSMPQDYPLDTDIDELDKDDDFFKCRADLSNIYKNSYNINILKEFIIDSVLSHLKNLLRINNEQDMSKIDINTINKYDIEFCLYLIYILQEGFIGNDFGRNDNVGQKLQKIYVILFSYPFTKIKNADYVLLSYYNTIYRGLENIKNNKEAIEYIIKHYISDEGIFYNGKNFYMSKILTSFDRFLSKAKMCIQKIDNMNFINIANTLKDSLYKLIMVIKNTQNFQLLKTYNLLFHSYGLIISLEKSIDNKKNLYEEALKLLTNIVNDFNSNNAQLNQAICEVILDCVIQFIQTVQIRNEKNINNLNIISNLFINFMDNFIGSYCINIIDDKNNSLLLKYINFLQRVLILLGANSLKYLEYFFQSNNCLNPNIISDCLKLEQNIITSLKKDSKNLVKKTFNVFYQFILKFNFPNDSISEENKILINIFIDFIKTFGIIAIDIPEVFFENGGIDNLNFLNIVEFVLILGNKFFEEIQRKSVIKSIKYLCNYFNKNKTVFETQPNFQQIIELILNNLFLIYKKINRNNVIDQTNIAEIVHCHILLLDFNNIYYNYLSKYLNQNELQQFVIILKNVEPKKLKISEELLNAFDHISNKLLK